MPDYWISYPGARPLWSGRGFVAAMQDRNTILDPVTAQWHEREYTERMPLQKSNGFWETLLNVFSPTTLSSLDEHDAQNRTRALYTEEEFPANATIGTGDNLNFRIQDPTNHDRMAMHYVYRCRVELVGMDDYTIANVDRAEKWVSAELRQHTGLRAKHLHAIKTRFMKFVFMKTEEERNIAVFGASRARNDLMIEKKYNRRRRGWKGFFLKEDPILPTAA